MALHFLADIHAGNHKGFATPTATPGVNSRLASVLDVLGETAQYVQRDDTVVILGDLFDTDKPSPQVIAAVMHTLDGFPCGRERVVCLRGNHDSATSRPGDNALGPLHEAGYTVVESPHVLHVGDTSVVLLPFRPDPPSTWVREALEALKPELNYTHHTIIGSHFGIADKDTPEYLREHALLVDDAFALCSEFSACAWLSGDWHTRRVWERDAYTVGQVGALVPTGFDNPGIEGYGSLWTFEPPARLTFREVAGPRFVKYRSARAAIEEPYSETCTKRYAQVTVKADDLDSAREELEVAVAAGKLAGFELHADREEAIENAGETAAYVATATSFEAALERAVERLDVPADVNRGEVLRRAKLRVAQAKTR